MTPLETPMALLQAVINLARPILGVEAVVPVILEDGIIDHQTVRGWETVAGRFGLPIAATSQLTAAMLRTAPDRFGNDLCRAVEQLVAERRTLALVALDAALERERDPRRRTLLEERQAFVAHPLKHRVDEPILGNRPRANEAAWLSMVDNGHWEPAADFSNCLGCPRAKSSWTCCRCATITPWYQSTCHRCSHQDCGAMPEPAMGRWTMDDSSAPQLPARLTDPWYEAQFVRDITPNGLSFSLGGGLEGAQGLWMCCPCGTGHAIDVPFADRSNAAPVPAEFGPRTRGGGARFRWTVRGTSLADLTILPSIDVGTPSCWHGHITNGTVTGFRAREAR